MTKQPQKEIKQYELQTCDLGKIISITRKIVQQKKKGQDTKHLQTKLDDIKAKSDQISQKIGKNLPKIRIMAELPIAAKAEELIELLQNNQVLIVAGETGCGKTTQLPKICLRAGFGVRGKIAHTQPRRVAATSVANRIASEIKSPLGELVGYAVRFSEKTSQNTRVKLMTDGILLSELQSDPMLSQYEVIIIDEAHERSLNIDFLLGFLKQVLKKRSELKVIVTSATIDPKSFSEYFDQAPILLVEGRTYPVEVRYLPQENNEENNTTEPVLIAIRNAVDICMSESSGDILIFSHGENEIKNITKYLIQQKLTQTEILPLYARLGIKEQQKIFSVSNKRKIIIATNVAETSLTIPNIVFVIDIGTARVSRYSQRNKIQQLPIEKISRASAEQRKGRCGRICPGICIRLYSKEDFDARPEFTLAEIKRTNLSSVVLRLKAMKVNQVETFPFIQSPDERQWKVAFNLLFELGAMTDKRKITNIGKRMAQLPLDPQLARILLSENISAIEELIIITSFLSVRDVRVRPHDNPKKADQLHAIYIDKASDIMTIIKLWRTLEQLRKEQSSSAFRRWCQKNLINFVGWLEWRNIYYQTKENLKNMGIKIGETDGTTEDVHKGLVSGFISHVMMKTPDKYYQGARAIKAWIHPSSQFFKSNSRWLLSTEMVETDKLYARNNVPVEPQWMEDIAPHLIKNNFQDIHWRKSKGYTAAFLSKSLLGLPILNRKLIDYSEEDSTISRELFLLEGLAKNNLNQTFPFVENNNNVKNEIELEEQKLRTSNIQISSEALALLFDNIIPSKIVNVSMLRRWLKADWKKRNRLLSFNRELLSHCDAKSIEDYPAEIVVRGVALKLTYSFAPGEPQDGVSVDIPDAMINQFKQSDFDWLVPGYLEQKILAVIKSLPKQHRKQLFPLADTASQCSQIILQQDYQLIPFKKMLVKTLKQLKNISIAPQEICLSNLPSQFLMKFKRCSSNTTTLSIESLLESVNKKTVENNIKNDHSSDSDNAVLYSWPNDFVGIETTKNINGQSVRLFYGLKDQAKYVNLQNFSSLEIAKMEHQQGVARLILIDQMRLLKELKNGWPERQVLEKYNLRFGGFEPLYEWITLSVAIDTLKNSGIISNRQGFNQLCRIFSSNARERISQKLIKVEKLLLHLNQIFFQLESLQSNVYSESVKDIKLQINTLWQAEYFIELGDSLYSTYFRYFSAIDSRLSRIIDNFPKEQSALDNWLDWQQWFIDINKLDLDFINQRKLKRLFWMMEEYRVSLFATNVKTQGSISTKKLQKMFDEIENNYN